MMTAPFGDGSPHVIVRAVAVSGSADIDAAALGENPEPRILLGTTRPTAAFSRRDTHLPGYERALVVCREHGFEPVIRPVGGRLAAYDEGSLVVHWTAPHRTAQDFITARFELFAATLAAALTKLGVPDVRVGSVPGEYCEGEWSVNTGGTAKLAGTGQRMNRHGFLFSAVVTVTAPERIRAVLTDAYAVLDLEFEPRSVGAVADYAPGVTVEDVIDELRAVF
ncbi:hypothetical protein KOI35_22805 [Actinoplanes bogorensis]|uniref:BPL/LPL catalytic domain-containing protein n=1 Tax=Paractinoplanes bogorensis TaxID=1610840 RepID=A0ABS5YSA9_9ACTN|nr:hypothetical protein [Actinoplanes bogorensis]MBU2666337.1 hypothetical protein [Actinoplanes bogorensis]